LLSSSFPWWRLPRYSASVGGHAATAGDCQTRCMLSMFVYHRCLTQQTCSKQVRRGRSFVALGGVTYLLPGGLVRTRRSRRLAASVFLRGLGTSASGALFPSTSCRFDIFSMVMAHRNALCCRLPVEKHILPGVTGGGNITDGCLLIAPRQALIASKASSPVTLAAA